jgi:VWFA-related protein
MYTAARTRLQLLADRTGGHLNEIHRLDDLARIYAIVAADLRSLYTMAYQRQAQVAHDGKWREIRIEVNRPDLVARTKPGYYAN